MSNKVYVGNLSWNTTEQELTEEFSSFGTVTEAKVIMDRETNRPKGFAFVTFADNAGADSAVTAMNGAEFGGRTLKVAIAENKPRTGGGGGRGNSGGGYNARNNNYDNANDGYSNGGNERRGRY